MIFSSIVSLPVRGAWIEIVYGARVFGDEASRSPCGERGLKLNQRVEGSFRLLSLPVRGAWIEILVIVFIPFRARSRSPCGERGLK